jgi:large subunit ribosomal protein L7e
LKKRKAVEKIRAEKVKAQLEAKAQSKKTRRVIFKRAESYVKEYRQREQEEIRLRRQAKATNGYYVPAEAKLAFVVRIKG